MNLQSNEAWREWVDCDRAAEAAMAKVEEYVTTVTYGGFTYIREKHTDRAAAQEAEHSLAFSLGKRRVRAKGRGGWPRVRTWKLVSESDTYKLYGDKK